MEDVLVNDSIAGNRDPRDCDARVDRTNGNTMATGAGVTDEVDVRAFVNSQAVILRSSQ